MHTNMIHYSSIVRLSTGSNLNLPIHAIDSGHGSRVRDLNGDEVDGYDEGNANELLFGYAWSYES
jgi:hypothetical protein